MDENKSWMIDYTSLDSMELLQTTNERSFRIPVFFSHPNINFLNQTQKNFINRLIIEIENALLFPRTLPETEQYPETVITNARRLIYSSYGLIAAALATQRVRVLEFSSGDNPPQQPVWQTGPFLQIEPAMAYQYGLPMLLIREKKVEPSGVFAPGNTPFLSFLEWDSTKPIDDFFDSIQWKEVFQNWVAHVRNGYYIQTNPPFQYKCDNID